MRAFIALTLLLCGCASTTEVLQRAPVAVIHSKRSAEAVVFCLQNKLDAPAMDLDGARVIISKSVVGAVIVSFTVRPEGAGSTVTILKGSQPLTPKYASCY